MRHEGDMDLATITAQNTRALLCLRSPNIDFMAAIRDYPYRGFIEAQITGCQPFVMFSNYDDIVAQHYLFRGPDSFESFSLKLWSHLSRMSKVVFDVGAFSGVFALAATHSNPEVKVVAFEPSLNTFVRLVTNVLANGMGGRIGTVKAALGERDGQLTLKHPAGIHCLGSEETLVDGRHESVWFQEEVRVMAGDQLSAHYATNSRDFVIEVDPGAVDLIKIDVEGFELSVLRGMTALLDRRKPTLLVECLSLGQFDEVFAFLQPKGYFFRFIDDAGSAAHQDRDRFAQHPRNVLFMSSDELLEGVVMIAR